MSGGGVKNLFDPAGVFHDNGSVSGQGFFDQGGALNSMLDPLDIFGGRATGEAKQQVKKTAAEQAAEAASAQSDLDAILAGGQVPSYGGTAVSSGTGGLGSYQPRPVLAPQLLQSPNRTVSSNQMPMLKNRAFNQVLAPLQQPNWGIQQVNPAYLTSINRFPNGQVPDGAVQQPQGMGQLPVRQGIQPINRANLNQRVWM